MSSPSLLFHFNSPALLPPAALTLLLLTQYRNLWQKIKVQQSFQIRYRTSSASFFFFFYLMFEIEKKLITYFLLLFWSKYIFRQKFHIFPSNTENILGSEISRELFGWGKNLIKKNVFFHLHYCVYVFFGTKLQTQQQSKLKSKFSNTVHGEIIQIF